jgi:autotransporter-associated beta strand protein
VSESGTYGFSVVISNGTTSVTSTTSCDLTAYPSWLDPGSAASWDSGTQTLSVTGVATITGDPGSDEPNIVADGPDAQVVVDPTTADSLVHIGGLTLTNGAGLTMLTVGASRSDTDHNTLVVGATGQTSDPTFSIDSSSYLDLQDNDLIIHTGSADTGGAAELSNVEAMAATGSDSGAWDGPELTSSVAELFNSINGYESNDLDVYVNAGSMSAWTIGSASETLGTNDVIVSYNTLPAGVTSASAATYTYNPSTGTLAVTGPATIVADPNPTGSAATALNLVADGPDAVVTVAPTDGSTLIHLGDLTLEDGASLVVDTSASIGVSVDGITLAGGASIGDGGNAADTLILGSGGITLNDTASVDTIDANIVLGAAQTWDTAGDTLVVNGDATDPSIDNAGYALTVNAPASNTVTIAAPIQGSGDFIKGGLGSVTLSGVNTYTGATTVDQGTLSLPQGLPFSGGTVTLADDPSVVVAAAGTIARNITALAPAVEGGGLVAQNGMLLATGNLTVGTTSSVFSFNGVINTQDNNTVTILTATPSFNSVTSTGVPFNTDSFTVSSVIMGANSTLTSNAMIYMPDAQDDSFGGEAGNIWLNDSSGSVSIIGGNFFGGTNQNGGSCITGNGGTLNFTGIVYGAIAGTSGESVDFLGAADMGF